jgi:hypothetical protein
VECTFCKKVHPLGVAPEPFAIWNKKLEGLFYKIPRKKQKTFPEDMYPAAPEPKSGYFL